MLRKTLVRRLFGWRCVQSLSVLASVSPCLWGFIGAGRPPYGGRAHYILLLPTGWTGAGPPQPLISREGNNLRFTGFRGLDSTQSIAVAASDPIPDGWGLFCPAVYTYSYGKIRWKDEAFPIRDGEQLRSEIDRVRLELAKALQTERATWYHVPPSYFKKYGAGEGTMFALSTSGVAVHAAWAAVVGLAIFATRKGRVASQALGKHDRLNAPKCYKCGYNLIGLSSDVCPECGTNCADAIPPPCPAPTEPPSGGGG